MAYLNKVFLMGNLTREPEFRSLPSGNNVCSFGMAINRQFTSVRGEQREEVCFVDVEAWGRTAEVIRQYVHKGHPIFIEGSLRYDQWDDKETQKKRSRLTVRCDRMQLIGAPSGNGGQQGGAPGAGAPQYGGGMASGGGYAPQGGGYGAPAGQGGYGGGSVNYGGSGGYQQAGGYNAQPAPAPASMPRFEPIPDAGNTSGGVPPMADEPVDDILF